MAGRDCGILQSDGRLREAGLTRSQGLKRQMAQALQKSFDGSGRCRFHSTVRSLVGNRRPLPEVGCGDARKTVIQTY